MKDKFLLYGANGYTAGLIIEFASQYGLTPVLAGRTASKIEPLAKETGLDCLVFGLDDARKIEEAIAPFDLVLHCAGPFVHTAKPMMKACIATKTHYTDITGEIEVFELGNAFGEKAQAAGITLIPGTGFDVVPTDCNAKYLSEKMPDATHLKIAFASIGGRLSHGTATTMAENLGNSGAVRKDGKIIPVPIGHKNMTVDFGEKQLFTMTIPWGDVSTAYYTTGIPNIETYTSVPPKTASYAKKYLKFLNPILKTSFVRNYQKRKIDKKPAGPSPEVRAKAKSLIWGEVSNEKGEVIKAALSCPEGYTLTAHTSLIIAKRILSDDFKPGFQTPAGAYGSNLIMELDGVKRVEI